MRSPARPAWPRGKSCTAESPRAATGSSAPAPSSTDRHWTCSCPWASPGPARKWPRSQPLDPACPSRRASARGSWCRRAGRALPGAHVRLREGGMGTQRPGSPPPRGGVPGRRRAGAWGWGLAGCLRRDGAPGSSPEPRAFAGAARLVCAKRRAPGEAGPCGGFSYPLHPTGRAGWGSSRWPRKSKGQQGREASLPPRRLPSRSGGRSLIWSPSGVGAECGCCCALADREEEIGRSSSSRGPEFSSVVTAAQKSVSAGGCPP